MEKKQTFFDFAAEVGLTKHLGGVDATEELVTFCHLSEVKYVLDVGCGAGVTPCYLAKRHNCRVVGVDILERMIHRSRERAEYERVAVRVEFRVADAQELPFENNSFDAVITESVTAFPDDQELAVEEYVRVTKPGGYVGLNESTWLKESPSPEMVAWVSQDVGANVEPLTAEDWRQLLENAGLREITVITKTIDVQDETRGILQRYGYGGLLSTMWRALGLYVRNSAYRQFLKGVWARGLIPQNLDEYFGYGIYVGRK